MSFFEALLLGIVQGLTEFLPISSSAHLILPSVLLGWRDQGLAFDIAVHIGSLIAIIIYLYDDIKKLEPFGTGNPNPIFLFKELKVIKINVIKNKHISIILKSKIGFSIKSICFDSVNKKIGEYLLNYKKPFNVLGQINENIWNNKKALQLTIQDLII